MAAAIPKKSAEIKKAPQYFSKLSAELKLDKYTSTKNKGLFELTSFQNMHDADLAYHHIYLKCAESAWNKEGLLRCLENDLQSLKTNPLAFNAEVYLQNAQRAIKEIERQLKSGSLDYLFQ